MRAQGIGTLVGRLSGGNQQKVVLARELSRDLRLLVAAQPTRGLTARSSSCTRASSRHGMRACLSSSYPPSSTSCRARRPYRGDVPRIHRRHRARGHPPRGARPHDGRGIPWGRGGSCSMTDPKITNDVPPPADTALEPGAIAQRGRAALACTPGAARHRRRQRHDLVPRCRSRARRGGILIALTDKDVQAAAGRSSLLAPRTSSGRSGMPSPAHTSRSSRGSIYNFRRPRIRGRNPPADGDAHVRHPAHRGGTRRRCRLPRGTLQHRWSRADARRGGGGGLRRFRVAASVRHPPHRRRGDGHARGRDLGGIVGLLELSHRCARSHRDDHAQLRGLLPHCVPLAHPWGSSGAGVDEPESLRQCCPRLCRPEVQPAPRIPLRDRSDDLGLVPHQPVKPRLPVPRGRR